MNFIHLIKEELNLIKILLLIAILICLFFFTSFVSFLKEIVQVKMRRKSCSKKEQEQMQQYLVDRGWRRLDSWNQKDENREKCPVKILETI